MISISDAVLVVAKGAHWRKSISLIPSFDAKGLTFLGALCPADLAFTLQTPCRIIAPAASSSANLPLARMPAKALLGQGQILPSALIKILPPVALAYSEM